MSTIFFNSIQEIVPTQGFVQNFIYDFKGKKVEKDGVSFRIISEESKATTFIKRITVIGLTILFVGFPLYFKKVRDICFLGKDSNEIAVLSSSIEFLLTKEGQAYLKSQKPSQMRTAIANAIIAYCV
jgi:hypothetical protein